MFFFYWRSNTGTWWSDRGHDVHHKNSTQMKWFPFWNDWFPVYLVIFLLCSVSYPCLCWLWFKVCYYTFRCKLQKQSTLKTLVCLCLYTPYEQAVTWCYWKWTVSLLTDTVCFSVHLLIIVPYITYISARHKISVWYQDEIIYHLLLSS